METYKLLYLKWKTNKDRLDSIQNVVNVDVALMGGIWGCMYGTAESICCTLKSIAHCE